MQTFIFGYGGLRLHVESLRLRANMPLPPDCNYLYLHRIKYLGSELSFNYTRSSIEIIVNLMNPQHKLVLSILNQSDIELSDRENITLNRDDKEYVIQSVVKTNCVLPYDKVDLVLCEKENGAVSTINPKNSSFLFIFIFLFLSFLIN